MDEIARPYVAFDDIVDSEQPATDWLRTIRELIKSRPDLTEYARTHAEYGGKHAERFMWRYFKKRRAALLNILGTLQFISTSQDDSIIRALRFILAHRQAKAQWLGCNGRRGRLNAHELHEQMTSCSCLTLILACIIYWQAKEIDRVLNECDPPSHGINTNLLEHISPIEWENVVLYGEYVLNRELIRRININSLACNTARSCRVPDHVE